MEIGDIFGFLVAAVFVGFSIMQRVARAKQESGDQRPRTPWPGPVAQPPAGTGLPQPAWPAPSRPAQQPPQPPQQRALVDQEGPEEEELVERELERFSRESERFDRQQIEGVAQFERQSAEFAGRRLNGLGGGLKSSEAATVTEDVSGVDMGLQAALGDPAAAARAVVLAEVLGKPKALRASHRYR